MRLVVQTARRERKDAFLFVNNRLDGNASSTIEAVVERVEERSSDTGAE
jgi:hypothetical protein